MKYSRHFVIHSILVVLFWVGTGGRVAHAQAPVDELTRATIAELETAIHEENVVGLSYAFFTSDQILRAGGIGWANKKQQLPATDTTIYGIGSITKLFTATLTLQTIATTHWSLTTPFVSLLPQIPLQGVFAPISAIQLKHVLAHQAGFPSDVMKGAFAKSPETLQKSRLATQAKALTPILPPGYMTIYSNVAYTLLGLALEHHYGTSYSALLRNKLLKPLQLQHTGVRQAMHSEKQMAQSYTFDGHAATEPYTRDIPAAGLYSTVNDVAVFGQHWLKGSLLPNDLKKEAWEPQNKHLPLDLDRQQGLGWQIRDHGYAGKVVFHTGATQYFRGIIAMAPSMDAGVVLLANSPQAEEILGIAFRWLAQLGKARGHTARPSANQWTPDALQRAMVAPVEWDTVTGTYLMPGYNIAVTAKKDHLQMQLPGKKLSLIPVDTMLFYPQTRWLCLFPHPEKQVLFSFQKVAGVWLLLQHHWQSSTQLFGYKAPPPQPISKAWQKRLGHFTVASQEDGAINYFTGWHLLTKDRQLYLKVKDKRSSEWLTFFVQPQAGKDFGILLPYGRNGGDLIHLTEEPFGLQVWGYQLVPAP